MSARFNLYLDDEREPKTARDWVIARSVREARQSCAARAPDFVSFDHDLGDGPTGLDFARWLVETDQDAPGWLPVDFDYNVHSANVVGRANIEGLLDGYLKFRKAA